MKPNLQLIPRTIIRRHLAALALREDADAGELSAISACLVLGLHLLGLAAFWRYSHQPIWLAMPTLALFLALPLFALRTGRRLAVETLAPLFFLYAVLLARVIAVRILLAHEPYQDEASFVDLRLFVFQVEVTAAAAIAYCLLAQVVELLRAPRRTFALVLAALALMAGSLAWFAVETIGHRTRGVTATDPYAYAQMAVDLATRGTPLHRFELFPDVANLGVSWYPIEHIGYRLFDNLAGAVPTVWPVGGSILLALAFRLLGEEGLYLATPLAALASLGALALLAWEYADDQPVAARAATTAMAVALLATSWEQVDRSIVPLVDAQAQLFTVLAVWSGLRAARTGRVILFGILGGLALGAAYWVRHTQLLIAIPMIVAAMRLSGRKPWSYLIAAGAAALVVALPDLWYHQEYFGSWHVPESQELALFSLSSMWPSVRALSERFFAGNEFGYLIPFLLYGSWRAARDNAWKFAVLAAWVLPLTGFHLLYAAVKMRDLLPEFPAVILLSAFGMVALVRDVRRWAGAAPVRQAAAGAAIFLTLLLPVTRDRLTWERPFRPAKVTFGYVTAAQRAAFDEIAARTPANAVIGSTMNDGPIDMYSGRATFRPGAWNTEERTRFVDFMQRAGRRVYLVDDGAETSAARLELSARYALCRVAVLDVPLFGTVDGEPGALWEIAAPADRINCPIER